MNPYARFLGTFSALLTTFLTPLLPAVAETPDPAQTVPGDTLVYVGWSNILNDELVGVMRSIPSLMRLFEAPEYDVREAEVLTRALSLAARGTGSFCWLDGSPTAEYGPPPFAIVVDAGDDTAALAELIPTMVASSTMGTSVIDGVTFDRPEDDLLLAVHKGRLIVATDEDTARAVLQALADQNRSLAAQDRYKAARKKVGAEASSDWLLSAYADVPGIIDWTLRARGQEAMPPRTEIETVLQHVGIDSVKSVYLHSDPSEHGMSTRLFVATDGEYDGILKLWEQEPLAEEDLQHIPKDAVWAAAGQCDLTAAWSETRRVIEQLNPQAASQVDGGLAGVSQMLGFSITEDLLPALGDTWILYDEPDFGGYLLTGAVLVADVKDAEKLKSIFGRILQMGAGMLAQNQVRLTAQKVEHEGHVIHYAVFEGWPMPIAPAAAFVGDRVVCALSPQPVKLAIAQMDPQRRDGSILDHPDAKKTRAASDAEIQEFVYMDTRRVMRQAYQLLHLLRTAAGSLRGSDIAALPTQPEVLEETRNSLITCHTDADGILYRAQGSPVAFFSGEPAVIAMLLSIMLPSLSRARELSKRAISAANLRQIGTALAIYANDHQGRYPESLDVLVEEGLVTEAQLLSPRVEDLRTAYVYIAGQSENTDARNILAYERVVGNEGTNVLFTDYHAEWMRLPEFKQSLLDTYKRLGREDEMPPELRY